MVEASVTWRNGMLALVYAEDFPELFKLLENEDFIEVNARLMQTDDTKKGKTKKGG